MGARQGGGRGPSLPGRGRADSRPLTLAAVLLAIVRAHPAAVMPAVARDPALLGRSARGQPARGAASRARPALGDGRPAGRGPGSAGGRGRSVPSGRPPDGSGRGRGQRRAQKPRAGPAGAAPPRARAPGPPRGSPRRRRRRGPIRPRRPRVLGAEPRARSLGPGSSARPPAPGAAARCGLPGGAGTRRPLVAGAPSERRRARGGGARPRAALLLAPGASSRRPASITAGAPGRKAGPRTRGLLKGQRACSGLHAGPRAPAPRASEHTRAGPDGAIVLSQAGPPVREKRVQTSLEIPANTTSFRSGGTQSKRASESDGVWQFQVWMLSFSWGAHSGGLRRGMEGRGREHLRGTLQGVIGKPKTLPAPVRGVSWLRTFKSFEAGSVFSPGSLRFFFFLWLVLPSVPYTATSLDMEMALREL